MSARRTDVAGIGLVVLVDAWMIAAGVVLAPAVRDQRRAGRACQLPRPCARRRHIRLLMDRGRRGARQPSPVKAADLERPVVITLWW